MTLAAFTTALDALVRRAAEGQLSDETLVVYGSPLKTITKRRPQEPRNTA